MGKRVITVEGLARTGVSKAPQAVLDHHACNAGSVRPDFS
jgi:hypothetical protein